MCDVMLWHVARMWRRYVRNRCSSAAMDAPRRHPTERTGRREMAGAKCGLQAEPLKCRWCCGPAAAGPGRGMLKSYVSQCSNSSASSHLISSITSEICSDRRPSLTLRSSASSRRKAIVRSIAVARRVPWPSTEPASSMPLENAAVCSNWSSSTAMPWRTIWSCAVTVSFSRSCTCNRRISDTTTLQTAASGSFACSRAQSESSWAAAFILFEMAANAAVESVTSEM
mmetsp:Transcript_29351/g.94669  ORF Transcript_29351/g.94669 Transcript_29351/m.94669 type:complete len:227 (+) Transcript_29351:76-756(+)